jgi:hypothetical protein
MKYDTIFQEIYIAFKEYAILSTNENILYSWNSGTPIITLIGSNTTELYASFLVTPLGTMIHKVNEGGLKKNTQSKLICMKAKT